ncbi:MAG TPA: uracil-DNA glycosylase family protein [Polyangia bacterium]|nr:uracil-DNA glycosylase family protein [Polyangia bacterium]
MGPAGRFLDEALKAARIERAQTYLTKAVKHFRWKLSEARGKRRLHERPNANEVRACRPWLLAEIEAIRRSSFAWARPLRARCSETTSGSPSSEER